MPNSIQSESVSIPPCASCAATNGSHKFNCRLVQSLSAPARRVVAAHSEGEFSQSDDGRAVLAYLDAAEAVLDLMDAEDVPVTARN